jgi:hypothetical protein
MAGIKLMLVELVKSIETPLASNACIWLQLTSLFLKSFRLKKSLLLSSIAALCPLLFHGHFVYVIYLERNLSSSLSIFLALISVNAI